MGDCNLILGVCDPNVLSHDSVIRRRHFHGFQTLRYSSSLHANSDRSVDYGKRYHASASPGTCFREMVPFGIVRRFLTSENHPNKNRMAVPSPVTDMALKTRWMRSIKHSKNVRKCVDAIGGTISPLSGPTLRLVIGLHMIAGGQGAEFYEAHERVKRQDTTFTHRTIGVSIVG